MKFVKAVSIKKTGKIALALNEILPQHDKKEIYTASLFNFLKNFHYSKKYIILK